MQVEEVKASDERKTKLHYYNYIIMFFIKKSHILILDISYSTLYIYIYIYIYIL